MLKKLFIKNYALIEALEIDFSAGFSVITGETGAGKSILLGALNAVLGDRIKRDLVKNNTQNCVIEAVFDVQKIVGNFCVETLDGEIIIRRVITPSGKSRCFINDEPTTVGVLKSIKPQLIDIHSQHQNLLVHESDFQLFVVDCLAETATELAEYKNIFLTWTEAKKSLAEWKVKQAEADKNKDFWQFQLTELESIDVQPNELSALELLQKQQDSIRELQHFGTALEVIEADGGVCEQLELIQGFESKFVLAFPQKKDLFEKLDELKLEIAALKDDFEAVLSTTDINPLELQRASERLAIIQRVQEKHRCTTEDDLLALQRSLQQKLETIDEIESETHRLEVLIESLYDALCKAGEVLSNKRKMVFADLQFSLEKSLKTLGMPFVQFSVEQKKLSKPAENGIDTIQFLFSANKGASLASLSESASGGEISRVMLVLKLLIAHQRALPTIIFDEIDTGISGKVAEQVGDLLRSMGAHAQVFAITHLPQVASKGEYHLLVEKNHEGEKTQSVLRSLNQEERVSVIAQMLSGETVTDSAKQHAQQMLF